MIMIITHQYRSLVYNLVLVLDHHSDLREFSS